MLRVLLTLAFASLALSIACGQSESTIIFSRDILPILSDSCYQCHGPDAKHGREGDLRLDDEADVTRDRGGYQVITAGKPESSELLKRVTSADPDLQMPPPERNQQLSKKQIETLGRWIEQGATWGRHWAFEVIQRPAVDPTPAHPIDSLVRSELERRSLKWNPPADRETLVRRLSLDLTGLPPTVEEIDAWLADSEPGAWERLVERTLGSSAYGERMAWDWLEVARYADSNGYQGDNERTMWPWRDWVVDAFNSNMPFDQFTIWQLAGDLLPNATDEQRLATGFNRNHMINGEGGRIAEENRVDYVMDMTETMGTTWLAMTLNCCRCHDHKFDPILQKEYYQFTAFFNQTPVDGGGGNPQTPPVIAVASSDDQQQEATLGEQIEQLATSRKQQREEISAQQAAWEQHILATASSSAVWRPVVFSSLESANGQNLKMQTDESVFVSGKNPDNDSYTLSAKVEASDISAIWLEALRHEKLTKGGYARSDSGNFVLTDFKVEWRAAGQADWQALKIATGQATFEQGAYKIEGVFDDDPQSGWAVHDGKPIDRDQWAILRLNESLKLPADAELRFTLRHDSPHKKHNLGHFRISITGEAAPEFPVAAARLLSILRIPAGERKEDQRVGVRRAFEESDPELQKLNREIARLEEERRKLRERFPKVMVMQDLETPRSTFMLDRGLYSEPREKVLAAFPSFLHPPSGAQQLNRLDLAQWLVTKQHPLTARVTVNRLWQMLFGIGLVKTAEDFGIQAEYPVHRELLDWLSAELIDSGWNVKHLLRTIVTSETYQQSSRFLEPADYERDPENRWLTRGPRFRMPSWMIRDQALAAAGLLHQKQGGAPVNTYQPEGIWEEATFGNKKYQPASGADLYRRSLYIFWRRIVGPTVFFDTAKRQTCEVKPLRTNTPMHALTTLNDVTYVESARALATLAMKQGQDDLARMRLLSRRVLARYPTDQEIVVWQRAWQLAYDTFARDIPAAERFLTHGDSQRDGSIAPANLAAWTALTLNLLNLDETLTKE